MLLLNLLTLVAAAAVLIYADHRVSIERGKIEAELRHAQDLVPLGLLDLSHGDTEKALETHRLVEPERLWTYDADYLAAFAKAVGEPVLREVYVERILLGWDRVFALALGLTSFVLDVMLSGLLEGVPVVWHLLVVGAGMSLLYAVADLAEDAKLAAIFLNDKGIDRGEAAAASALTRIKIVSITLSFAGIAIFQALQHLPAIPLARGTLSGSRGSDDDRKAELA